MCQMSLLRALNILMKHQTFQISFMSYECLFGLNLHIKNFKNVGETSVSVAYLKIHTTQ